MGKTEAGLSLLEEGLCLARETGEPIVVAYALTNFGYALHEEDQDERARELLTKYADQAFSYVDAIVLMAADGDSNVQTLLTVDSSLTTFAFSHPVVVVSPPRRPV